MLHPLCSLQKGENRDSNEIRHAYSPTPNCQNKNE